MDNYSEVTVSIDIMKVNKIPFLVSISDHIHYGTSPAMSGNEEEEQSRSNEESMNEQDNNNDVVNDEVPEDNNSDADESVENTGVDRTDEDVPSTDDNSVHTENLCENGG